VEDLVTCLLWSLENPDTLNQTIEIGGAEYFPFRQALEIILQTIHSERVLIPLNLPYLRALTITLETALPGFPLSTFWVDYFSNNRTCATDTIPRLFGFLPARFTYRLDHLKNINWARLAIKTFFVRRPKP
jgi:NADH dehydrogenase